MERRTPTRPDEHSEAHRARRRADAAASMRERLARLHALSKQMTAIKGSARGD